MTIFIRLFCLWVLSTHAFAGDKPSADCIKSTYAAYSDAFRSYWKLIGKEFKTEDPELYSEFSYSIKEQLNYSRMSEIKLNYLLENYPENLELERKIYRVAPSYANYENTIFRELRLIEEYDRLYLENRSYHPNVKMPDYERRKIASQLIADIRFKHLSYQREVEEKFAKPVMELTCDS